MIDKWNEIREILKWAENQGIEYLKLGELEVRFKQKPRPEVPKPQKTAQQLKYEQEKRIREEEDILYGSV